MSTEKAAVAIADTTTSTTLPLHARGFDTIQTPSQPYKARLELLATDVPDTGRQTSRPAPDS
jgi:hypothetical protein